MLYFFEKTGKIAAALGAPLSAAVDSYTKSNHCSFNHLCFVQPNNRPTCHISM